MLSSEGKQMVPSPNLIVGDIKLKTKFDKYSDADSPDEPYRKELGQQCGH